MCNYGYVPLSHLGNIVMRTETTKSKQYWCVVRSLSFPLDNSFKGKDSQIILVHIIIRMCTPPRRTTTPSPFPTLPLTQHLYILHLISRSACSGNYMLIIPKISLKFQWNCFNAMQFLAKFFVVSLNFIGISSLEFHFYCFSLNFVALFSILSQLLSVIVL